MLVPTYLLGSELVLMVLAYREPNVPHAHCLLFLLVESSLVFELVFAVKKLRIPSNLGTHHNNHEHRANSALEEAKEEPLGI